MVEDFTVEGVKNALSTLNKDMKLYFGCESYEGYLLVRKDKCCSVDGGCEDEWFAPNNERGYDYSIKFYKATIGDFLEHLERLDPSMDFLCYGDFELYIHIDEHNNKCCFDFDDWSGFYYLTYGDEYEPFEDDEDDDEEA